ncbi:MAG: MFS transporter [Candidatus Hydrogenedentes bacterium]|nr:MFS transporter [Candidatus Hydrogenedentota bacterium]
MGQGDQEKLPQSSKGALRQVFLVLFIDLVGFSIIFPLFPGMLAHYEATEAAGSLFAVFFALLRQVTVWAGAPNAEWSTIVLFGGLLGGLYSFLQFLCAPFFGALSDRVGRRPVLLVSIAGTLVAYAMWFFAGNFALLVCSRLISGIMSANISTATAVVSDVTSRGNRSKGMAVIGIAFGLGFILGPAIGGVSTLVDLSAQFPGLVAYGVNPYSMAALVAAILTAINLVMVLVRFEETLPLERRGRAGTERTLNPLALLSVERFPGVNRTILAYFLFLLAFSGMEFSLTFLAVERLGYTERSNAGIFLFVGLVLALMQGGYVHRFGDRIAPRSMAVHGFLAVIPGLMIIGWAGHVQSGAILFLGLFFLSVGAAQAMPCLTALVSLYTPDAEQGRILGIFRSLGALARALGPLSAGLLYWRLGPAMAYAAAGLFLIVPLLLTQGLPHPARERMEPVESQAG